MPKHPSDRRQRLAIKKQKYEELQPPSKSWEEAQAEARTLRKKREWLKLQEAQNELSTYRNGLGG